MLKFEKEKYKTFNPKNEEGWLKKRCEFITATEAMFAICNFCNDEITKNYYRQFDIYKTTPYQFYCQKTMSSSQNELWREFMKTAHPNVVMAQQYGCEQEEFLSKKGLELLIEKDKSFEGAEIIANKRRIYYIEGENISATPDFIIQKQDGSKVILECKTFGVRNDNKNNLEEDLENSKKSDIVEKYKMQVITQMLCTGIEEAYIVFMSHTGDRVVDIELFDVSMPDEILEDLQEKIIQSSNDCINWIKNCNNGSETIEPDKNNENDLVLFNIVNKTLKQLLNDYLDNEQSIKELEKLEKEKETNYKLLTSAVKMVASQDIVVDGISIDYSRVANSYYNLESVDKKIKELEEIKARILAGEEIISRNGYVKIKNIIRVEDFNNM